MHHTTRIATWLALGVVATIATAGSPSAPAASSPEFDTLKKLAGDWQLNDPKGEMNGTVRYQLTSAGSALVETMTPGTPHEMVTIYTQDGAHVAVTHYCAMGNQPHLMSSPVTAANQLHFNFVSGGNMKSAKDGHMHSLTLTFLDDNHLKQEWQFYKDGKPTEMSVFTLTRKT